MFNKIGISKWLKSESVRVSEHADGPNFSIRSSGLSDLGLHDVEISGCPGRLTEVASNLVLQIALNGKKSPESLRDGKTIGGRFAHAKQPLLETFCLRRPNAQSRILRIVDLQDAEMAFPRRLVATHLCASAGTSSKDSMRLLLVSIEVWPKEKVASNAALADYELNPNNFWSWIDLGTTFSHAGHTEAAYEYWKTALCMWPRGGKLYASKMLARLSSKTLVGDKDRLEQQFWHSVSDRSIQSWCVQLDVGLTDEMLDD